MVHLSMWIAPSPLVMDKTWNPWLPHSHDDPLWQVSMKVGEEFLPAVACMVYILPLLVVARSKRYWQTVLFTCFALLIAFYHTLDILDPSGTMRCHDFVVRAASVTTCLSVIQVALVVLGPEDPWVHKNFDTGLMEAPFDVLICGRVIPAAVLVLVFFLGNNECPWCSGSLCVSWLLCAASTTFWLATVERRIMARDVLLRKRFWAHVLLLFILPVTFFVLVDMIFAQKPPLIMAVRHVIAAFGAASALKSHLCENQFVDYSVSNPMIMHWLLSSCLVIFLPMMVSVLVADARSYAWRWPTLSMASESGIGRFVFLLGTPFLCLAAVTVFWIIGLALPNTDISMGSGNFSYRQKFLHAWGCHLGYVSIFFGVLVAMFPQTTVVPPLVHISVTCIFFISSLTCVWLTTAAAIGQNTSTMPAVRLVTTITITALLFAHVILFCFVNEKLPNSFGFRHSTYAIVEYMLFLMLVLWPITWVDEVQHIADPFCTRKTCSPIFTTADRG